MRPPRAATSRHSNIRLRGSAPPLCPLHRLARRCRFIAARGAHNEARGHESMKALLKGALALTAIMLAGHASADVTFYEHENFGGRAVAAQEPVDNFRNFGFNDRASSVVVTGEDWEVCEDAGFRGRCMILRPGNYASLRAMDMNNRLSSARAVGREHHHERGYAPAPMPGEIVFYEHDDFRGRGFAVQGDVVNFQSFGFNDRASSVVVL